MLRSDLNPTQNYLNHFYFVIFVRVLLYELSVNDKDLNKLIFLPNLCFTLQNNITSYKLEPGSYTNGMDKMEFEVT